MRIDLHVHTNRYSKCSTMTPEAMAQAALAARLDGVVITEHNVLWPEEELEQLRQQFPSLLILRGFEVSADDRHDVLIYGVADIARFYKGMPVQEAVNIAHALGGFVILAHAFRYHETLPPEILSVPYDACETCSINIDPLQAEQYIALAHTLGVPQTHNSDGHFTVSLGGYYNEFHVPVRNEADLLAALRNQAFTPCEDAQLVKPALDLRLGKVEDRIRRIAAQGITDPEDVFARIGGSRERVYAVLAKAGTGCAS